MNYTPKQLGLQFIAVLVLTSISLDGYSQYEIGSASRESLRNNGDNLKVYGLNWTYQGREYTLDYEQLDPSIDLLSDSFFRKLFVYGRDAGGEWAKESREVFTSVICLGSKIEYKSTPITYGGSGLVTDLENGYVLITQLYNTETYSARESRFSMILLKYVKRDGYAWSWDVNVHTTNIHMKWAKEVVKIDDDTYHIIMNNGHDPIKLIFDKNGYEYLFKGHNLQFGRSSN